MFYVQIPCDVAGAISSTCFEIHFWYTEWWRSREASTFAPIGHALKLNRKPSKIKLKKTNKQAKQELDKKKTKQNKSIKEDKAKEKMGRVVWESRNSKKPNWSDSGGSFWNITNFLSW